jgi:hypothetical protein
VVRPRHDQSLTATTDGPSHPPHDELECPPAYDRTTAAVGPRWPGAQEVTNVDSQVPTPTPQQTPASTGGFDFGEFISFRFLITPTIITIVYVIGAVLITLGALGALAGGGGSGLVFGLLFFFFGNLYWRVILEFVVVLFRMNDSLRSIDRRGKGM